jgi:hypothetical protein
MFEWASVSGLSLGTGVVSCWHGMLFIAWLLWLCAVSRLAGVVASRAVLAWLAALRVGSETEMRVAFRFLAESFCQPFLFSRDPAFRCRRTRDRTGKG